VVSDSPVRDEEYGRTDFVSSFSQGALHSGGWTTDGDLVKIRI
jgi:hypothetical protein